MVFHQYRNWKKKKSVYRLKKGKIPLSQPSVFLCSLKLYTKDRHALESAASLYLLQKHPLLALQRHRANFPISTLWPHSLCLYCFIFLSFVCLCSHILTHSFESGFALMFTPAVRVFSKCLKCLSRRTSYVPVTLSLLRENIPKYEFFFKIY